jgi:biotin-(acetyl-CoA carboxylase) ligase
VAQWRADDPALARDYRDRCQTLGRLVTVDAVEGRVTAIDDAGRLVVTTDGAQRTVAADDPSPVLR